MSRSLGFAIPKEFAFRANLWLVFPINCQFDTKRVITTFGMGRNGLYIVADPHILVLVNRIWVLRSWYLNSFQ